MLVLDNNKQFVPSTKNRYLCYKNGKITDIKTGEEILINNSNKTDKVKIYFLKSVLHLDVSVIVALSWKANLIPSEHYGKLKVFFIDGDNHNIDPENLLWKFPTEGLNISCKKDFFLIPDFTRYVINSEGKVYNRLNKTYMKPYKDIMGYNMYGLTPDVGKRTIIGTHRLKALVFLNYPANYKKLDVNHKDGIKDNNDLDNLEWATRQENCLHAYRNGLRNDNKPVVIFNSFSYETKTFYSIEECARVLNIDGETLRLRLQNRGSKVYFPGIQFKLENDSKDFVVFKDPIAAIKKASSTIPVIVKNLLTDTYKTYNSISMFARDIDKKPAKVIYQIRSKGFKYKHYELEYPNFVKLTMSFFVEI